MNENNTPLFGGEENQPLPLNEDITTPANEELPTPSEEPSFEPSTEAPAEVPDEITVETTSDEPVKEPFEASEEKEQFMPSEAPAFTEPDAFSSPSFKAEPTVPEEPAQSADVFNPYAPKTSEAAPTAEPTANQTQGYSQSGTYSVPNNQVNPSYNRPLNQGYGKPGSQQPYNNGTYSPYQTPSPKDNKNGKIILLSIIGVCLAVGLIAIISSFFGKDNTDLTTTFDATQSTASAIGEAVSTTVPTTTPSAAISTTQGFDQGINSIWVAEKVRPSVVGVLAYQQGELSGEGSGVLMREDTAKKCTYVITCAHVINEPGCEFVILLLDGSVYEAEIVALDERTDIGVLKINTTGLPLAEFGDSSSLKIGEPIYAIGNPGGSEYFGSITNGIVAAIDRSISATYTMTCIQHNAAINPGNSGGALVNTAGQVIGINSSKIAKTDFEGMGFAVPSAIFVPVVEDLIQHGYVPNRPELGIKYASVSDYQLYSIIVSIKGLPRESIIIAEIPEGSALSGTQAQVGDLIIAVNGKKMDSSDVLLDLIDTGAVGDTLTLTLCRVQDRSYETTTFDVTVQLVEDKGSITTTTQAATLPQQDGYYGDFGSFFDDFFGW